jgi:hypothetical protein
MSFSNPPPPHHHHCALCLRTGPLEGENDMETYHLVQELAAQGVADVSSLGTARR